MDAKIHAECQGLEQPNRNRQAFRARHEMRIDAVCAMTAGAFFTVTTIRFAVVWTDFRRFDLHLRADHGAYH